MVKVTVARENSDYNKQQDADYYDYTNYKFELGDIERYRIFKRVARGKYSEVFEGRMVLDDEENKIKKKYKKIIIKALKPIKIAKVNREVKILKTLQHPNIISLFDIIVDIDTQIHSLIFEYLNHTNTTYLFEKLGLNDIRHYSKQILQALAYSHSKGIMHRDIKPQNVLIDPETKELKVIDWGLAEFYHPETLYTVRVATRYYKSPELLINYGYYDYSLDIWAFGCIFAEMLFGTRPIFGGKDDLDQLIKITEVFGTDDLLKYCKKLNIDTSSKPIVCLESTTRKDWNDLYDVNRAGDMKNEALDLLNKCLTYDHTERITASEALLHPFFED